MSIGTLLKTLTWWINVISQNVAVLYNNTDDMKVMGYENNKIKWKRVSFDTVAGILS